MNTIQIAKGTQAWLEWLGGDKEPVLTEVAQKRADVCRKCVENQSAKGFDQKLAEGAAKVVRQMFRLKTKMKLEVSGEEALGICNVCECPLKLKVWSPLDHILAYTEEEALDKLPPNCWIVAETMADY